MKKSFYLLLAIASCLIANGQGTLDFENFEADGNGATSGFSFWNNVSGDAANWQVESPNINNSGNTGPLNGSGHTKYLYTEASAPRVAGDEFWLVSDAINAASNPISVVTFDYHMWDNNSGQIGTLTLEYSTTGTADSDFQTRFSLTGQQQTSQTEAYRTASVNFYGIPVKYLRFKVVQGGDYRGDVALDNITVRWAPSLDVENFEADANGATSGFSFWNNVGGDAANWQIESPNVSNSGNTGPLNGDGHSKYLYTEASAPRVAGDEFWLVSDAINPASMSVSKVCFEYHMWDNNSGQIGTLALEYSTTGNADSDFQSFWSVSGQQHSSQTAAYTQQVVDFSGLPVTYLRFRAIQGGDYRGDISIDNIAVYSGPAEQHAVPTLSQWGVITLILLVLCLSSIAIWKKQYEPVYPQPALG